MNTDSSINQHFNIKFAFLSIWHFFSSVKLAFALIIIIACLSLIGVFILQAPSEVYSDSQYFQWWLLNIAEPEYGMWTPLLAFLQLFGIFRSVIFLTAVTLLMLNILICSINRWRVIKNDLRLQPARHSPDFYLNGKNHIDLVADSSSLNNSSAEKITVFLGKRGYHLHQESSENSLFISASKYRFTRLGTYFIHLSLILFVLGFLIGNLYGFRNNSFIVAEGESREVGYNTGLSLALTSFQDTYWPDGTPEDYRSKVILYASGQTVSNATIRVNHPLYYHGIRFYQSAYGPAAHIQVQDSAGADIFNGNLALSEPLQISSYLFYSGTIDLASKGIRLFIIAPEQNSVNPMIQNGELAIQIVNIGTGQVNQMSTLQQGTPANLGEISITYLGESQFSSFQVSRDPGVNLIWVASALFLIGLVSVLYFPTRHIWIFVSAENNQGRILMRGSTSRILQEIPELPLLAQELSPQWHNNMDQSQRS